ncbi:hypothetical protein D4764_06G0007480 [Takifugu flavidus]|uniref:Uncharacterized protein n=1 Tax=Takifugu flavidus TaxID=433684 RepID=A0A5C6MXV3_9TELE|nr:hypothetical protein D4764_06G0007480 [Takifugu flavidus]
MAVVSGFWGCVGHCACQGACLCCEGVLLFLSSLRSWRTAVPEFSAVLEDCCSRVLCGPGGPLRFPSSLQSWRTASVPEFPVALEGRFGSRVSCCPGGPLLFPSFLLPWRAASVPEFLVALEGRFCSLCSAVLEDCPRLPCVAPLPP